MIFIQFIWCDEQRNCHAERCPTVRLHDQKNWHVRIWFSNEQVCYSSIYKQSPYEACCRPLNRDSLCKSDIRLLSSLKTTGSERRRKKEEKKDKIWTFCSDQSLEANALFPIQSDYPAAFRLIVAISPFHPDRSRSRLTAIEKHTYSGVNMDRLKAACDRYGEKQDI